MILLADSEGFRQPGTVFRVLSSGGRHEIFNGKLHFSFSAV